MHWLLDRAEVEPERLLRVGIDFPAVAYEVGGPEELIDALVAGHPDQNSQPAVIEKIWRVDHPRVEELLQAIGEHHPDNRVAKPARKSLLRHRSCLAGRR